jgi:sulfatase maturation enzyme AslB (radical SAM superfamily)
MIHNSERIDLSTYIVVSIWFGCNNDCTICMLSGLKRNLPPIGFNRFKQALGDIKEEGRLRNLILSGAEVTTFDDVENYIRYAASLGWFEKIQIQTNGRRLADKDYLSRLIAGGVNEFFVSIHGLEDVNDRITQVPGSFREAMAGIRHLAAYRVNVITNTVLTKFNYHDIPPLMEVLCKTAAREIHMWNFYPMAPSDCRDLVVDLQDFDALHRSLLPMFRTAGKPLVLKSFPECLAVGKPVFFDSLYPVTILPNRFWEQFSQSGFGICHHRQNGRCGNQNCWGLSRAYVEKYGDERNFLSPMK